MISLTAACPLLLFIGGIPPVWHKPGSILFHFRLLLTHLVLNTFMGTIIIQKKGEKEKVATGREETKGKPISEPRVGVVFE